MARKGIFFPLKDAALRDDVHALGELVGEVLKDQCGQALFDLVEGDRHAAIGRRQGEPEAAVEMVVRAQGRAPKEAQELIRAFSTWFQVVNLAEKVHRVRRRRQYMNDSSTPQPGRFVRASLKGWEFTLKNPEEAIDILAKHRTEIDKPLMLANLKLIIDLWRTDRYKNNGIGWVDDKKMADSIKIISQYRDIKVDNILLAADGRAILTDFGIARVATASGATATGPNMTIGTPHYISPEQAQGRPVDGRADLYALGVTLYKAATGELPFRSSDWFELARMHVEEPPTPPTSHRADLSGRFERVMPRCLAKHPDDRDPSADALAKELDELMAGRRQTKDIAVPRMRATTNRPTLAAKTVQPALRPKSASRGT